jgi:poly(hydroxyalkanoate) depolymerase family esterase
MPQTGPAGWLRRSYDNGDGRWPYAVYVPRRLRRWRRAPVMVVLHGCTQTPEDIAAGTGINALADRHRFVAVYPQQRPANNRNRCWNWYLRAHQARGAGEPAAIAGIVEQVLGGVDGPRLDRNRVYVVGLSAGASMAVVMGVAYPDLVAGVGAHSGLSYAAARTAPGALLSMRNGSSDPQARGRQAWLAWSAIGDQPGPMPVVVVQGADDRTVRPVNGGQVVSQWLATNRLALSGALDLDEGRPDRVDDGRSDGGLPYEVRTWNGRGGRPLVQHWQVSGLGHAWSGGSPAGSFTDPAGPSASSAMWAFLRQQARGTDVNRRRTPFRSVRRTLGG